MRPFEKDSQSVVTKGRRKTKLAAPKSKSAAAALIKRKNRNVRNKKENNEDGTTTNHQHLNYNCNLTNEPPCHFVPVRRKPLGEYMKLEKVPMGSTSSSLPSMQGMQGMPMSYAAAIETGSGVKVMISPRLNNKPNTSSSKSGKAGKANKITADTKFRIFDEQPKKPHIVHVDPKLFEPKSRVKNSKVKKPMPQKTTNKPQSRITSQSDDPNDVDIKALQLQLKIEMECNAASAATVAIKGNTLSVSNGQQRHVPVPDSHPTFADSVSYLSYHRERLQRMIKNQQICAICLQSPEEPMKIPQFEDKHFKCLEEAALLAQNRTMLRLWMNSDQLIC